jgi:hypothetical protein
MNLVKQSNEEVENILTTNIKTLGSSDDQLTLVERLMTYLQLKELEKRTDYNRFGEESKIDMLMENSRPPTDINRIRRRMQILGLC